MSSAIDLSATCVYLVIVVILTRVFLSPARIGRTGVSMTTRVGRFQEAVASNCDVNTPNPSAKKPKKNPLKQCNEAVFGLSEVIFSF